MNLAAEKATAEDEKASLLEKKAAAEAEAKAAAEAEAAYKAKQASQQQTVVASGNTTFTAQVQALSTVSSSSSSESSSSESSSSSASTESTSYTPAPVTHRPTYSTNASSYPTGECTWGAKHWRLGLEITGVMEHSGLQVQLQQDSVQDLHLKLVPLHVGMMVDMDT